MKLVQLLCLWAGLTLAAVTGAFADDDQDIVLADFEGDSYGQWNATGEAFGSGPAEGKLPGQMPVSGHQGKRLVNSFYKGDRTTGTLTSPPFKVERDFITFLIGGGGHEGKTCLNLLLDGEVVRTATGSNTRPGGSEQLSPNFWSVKDLLGKSATIQIVDQATGGWGHVNVDHIVQSDTMPKVAVRRPFSREFTVTNKYLLVPIQNGARTCEVTLEVDGKAVRRYTTELATDAESVDWYAFFALDNYQDKTARAAVNSATEEGFALIRQSDEIPGSDTFYTEQLRPQFHFSQQVGWNNDPNGMVYHDGEWHLYFQHNPVGWKWGNMTWGHAVSNDLVHWKQLPNALFPATMARGACFSGSAVIDRENTAGFRTGEEHVLVAFLTDTGAGEAIAYSQDRGRTFTWYDKNPVVKHRGRDPKVIWYEPGKHWVMVVYDEQQDVGRNAAFYTSTNLKDWKEQSHLPGYFECPELFELPVDGDQNNTRWVVFAADVQYAIGSFDGKVFTPEHEGKHRVHHGSYYASQTFDNAPDGRKIQIGWARIAMPGMPFNQTFSFPHQLTLRTTGAGTRMFAEPVDEIAKLHKKQHTDENKILTAANPADLQVTGDIFDIRATFEIGTAAAVGLDIGGQRVTYDVPAEKLNGAELKPVDGTLAVQVLVDRPMLEICGNRGRVCITAPRAKQGGISRVRAFADGGQAKLLRLEVNELESIWNQ